MLKNLKPFAKGKSGNPAGRPKGSKNKFNVHVAQICERNGCNPIEIMAQIAADTLKLPENQRKQLTLRMRFDAACALAEYLAPKLKHVEHAGDKESPVKFVINLGHST